MGGDAVRTLHQFLNRLLINHLWSPQEVISRPRRRSPLAASLLPVLPAIFSTSKYRPDQSVCSAVDCQRRRRSDYHRQKLSADPEYAQVARDSQRKWRAAHPDYQKQYWQSHPEALRKLLRSMSDSQIDCPWS